MKFTRTLIALSAATLMATSAMAMEPAEYKATHQISADYKANKQNVTPCKATPRMSARRKPKGAEKVAKAELEARYKPSDKAAYKARVAKADADYEVAKEKCDDLSGNAKDVREGCQGRPCERQGKRQRWPRRYEARRQHCSQAG